MSEIQSRAGIRWVSGLMSRIGDVKSCSLTQSSVNDGYERGSRCGQDDKLELLYFYKNLFKCVYFVVANCEVSFKMQEVIGSIFHRECFVHLFFKIYPLF